MSIKNKKPALFKVGDLVTRDFRYTSEPALAYGIILEIQKRGNKRSPPDALVFWFKDAHRYNEKRRINNTRHLRLVNSA
jgi:hypothetical protein